MLQLTLIVELYQAACTRAVIAVVSWSSVYLVCVFHRWREFAGTTSTPAVSHLLQPSDVTAVGLTDCELQRNLRVVLHINFIFREMILVALYVQHYRSASVFSWSHCCHQNALTDNCCNLHQKSSWMFRECLSERGNRQQVPVSVFFLFVGLLFPWDSHLIWDQPIASSALCWWVEQQILERTDAAFMKRASLRHFRWSRNIFGSLKHSEEQE